MKELDIEQKHRLCSTAVKYTHAFAKMALKKIVTDVITHLCHSRSCL